VQTISSTAPRWQWLLLGGICLASLGLRSAFHYSNVFKPDSVRFTESDAYYHMRHVEHMVHNFPHRMSWDPYGAFPSGQPEFSGPLFDYLLAGLIWLAGAGSPSKQLMETIAAWFPAVLGALIPIAVFYLGRLLFSATTGLVAAAFIAVLPGFFLNISALGFTDHHVLESLLSCIVLYAYGRALESGSLRWSLVFGAVLGAYLLTWVAGSLVVAILVGWTLLACLFRHWKSESCQPLGRITIPALLLAFLIHLPAGSIAWGVFTQAALIGGAVSIAVVCGLSAFFQSRSMPRVALYLTLAVLGAGAAGICWMLAPGVVQRVLMQIGRMSPSGPWRTINELQPLIRPTLMLTLSAIWGQFVLAGPLAAGALYWLALRSASAPHSGRSLFLFYSAVMMGDAMLQTRICYYAAPCVAILAAYPCAEAMRGSRLRRAAAAAMLTAVIAPSVPIGIVDLRARGWPTESWWKLASWLRNNTPEPFLDEEFYYQRYPKSGSQFTYPVTAYGIMNWWDFGHIINYAAHRIPVSNPHQTGAILAARFYMAETESEAMELLRKAGARYVIVDPIQLVFHSYYRHQEMIGGGLEAMSAWAGRNPSRYYDVISSKPVEGIREQLVIYYPEYYRMMVTRLNLYNAKQVPSTSTWVISVKLVREGRELIPELDFSREFDTYAAAEAFKTESGDPKWMIVGLNPLATCVPLENLPIFDLVYEDESGFTTDEGKLVPGLKVFKVSLPLR